MARQYWGIFHCVLVGYNPISPQMGFEHYSYYSERNLLELPFSFLLFLLLTLVFLLRTVLLLCLDDGFGETELRDLAGFGELVISGVVGLANSSEVVLSSLESASYPPALQFLFNCPNPPWKYYLDSNLIAIIDLLYLSYQYANTIIIPAICYQVLILQSDVYGANVCVCHVYIIFKSKSALQPGMADNCSPPKNKSCLQSISVIFVHHILLNQYSNQTKELMCTFMSYFSLTLTSLQWSFENQGWSNLSLPVSM